MKKKVLNGLLMGGIGLLAMSSVAAVTLTSCESSQTTPAQDATMKLYNEYNEAVANAVGNQTGYITKDKADAVIQVMDNYISQAQTLNDQIQESGSVDEQIWISSVLFQLQSEKLSVTTEAYLLGAPIGGNIISAYSNDVVDYASYFDYGNNLASWTSRIDTFESVLKAVQANFKEGLAKNTTLSGIMVKLFVSNTLQKLYAPQLDAYVAKGTEATPITSANLVSTLGNATYFQNKVNAIPDSKLPGDSRTTLLAKATEADKLIDSWVSFLVTDYWSGVKYGWSNSTPGTAPAFGLSVVAKNATGEVTNTFAVPSSQPNTIKGLGLTQDDLNTKDIGIGFSTGKFGADSKWNGKSIGLTIYEDYLLYKNTTIYNKAVEVNKEGLNNVGYIVNNMRGVAEYLASKLAKGDSLVNNTWQPKGYTYDENIFDDQVSVEFTAPKGLSTYNPDTKKWTTSDEQLTDFFKWLNADQWFFGRDVAPNQVVTLPDEASNLGFDIYFEPNVAGEDGQGKVIVNPSVISTSASVSPVLFASETTSAPAAQAATQPATGAKYSFDMKYANELGSAKVTDRTSNNFGDAGNLYEEYVVNAKGIAPGAANISGAQAYAGASFSMDSYYRLRDAILPKVTEIFVKSADSDVHAPSQLDLRTNIITGVGGAAYANGGTFYLDVNPFYGLQKWSMTTLLSHESLPGHNLQMIYAVDNTSSEYAPQLSYTSYAEGWGLFSEWLASQYGSYGEPAKVTGNEWQDSAKRMQLPDFDDNTFDADNKVFGTVNIDVVEANKEVKNGEFMNGSYETDFEGLSTTDANSLDQGYYNAMQYFGFLNERQLRAMRMVLDTSVHAGGPTVNEAGKVTVTDSSKIGTAAKGTGWSLQDEMNYMHGNSGLGQGDITREAQRYLNYTAQATSYLTGENVIEGLFGDASAAYAAANNGALFMNYADLVSTQNNTAPFFNLILRNNDIPLKVLEKYVKQYITENIGAIPAKAAESSSSK